MSDNLPPWVFAAFGTVITRAAFTAYVDELRWWTYCRDTCRSALSEAIRP